MPASLAAGMLLLLVEDNRVDRERVHRWLAGRVELVDAATAAEALEACERAAFDCVLLDHGLPDRDGLTILPALVAREIPVVFLTGQSSDEIANRALQGGAQDWLGKHDLTRSSLVRAIRHAVERQRGYKLFRAALDAAPSGMMLVDGDGRIALVNGAVEELFGYSRSELVGQPVELLVAEGQRDGHGLEREEWARHPVRRVAAKRPTLVGRHKDGSPIPVGIGINPLDHDGQSYVIVSVDDRREILRAQRQLRDNERRLFEFLESLPVGVHVMTAAGQSYYANRSARAILGEDICERANAADLGSAYGAFVRGSAKPYPLDEFPLLRALAGEASSASDMDLRQGGESRFVEMTAAPIYSSQGQLEFAIAAFRDLTAQVELQQQLHHAQRLEAIGQLAGGVAHDFNNLLTVIFSFGSFVLEDLDEDSQSREDMKELLGAAERAQRLTAQLLMFSRRQKVEPRVLRVTEVVSNIDRLLRRMLGEQVELHVHHARDLWNVRADLGALEQVLVNLAVNARDAMPDGGALTIETSNSILDESFAVAKGGEVAAGDYVTISVSDTGMGMHAATVERIFEPFFTTKGSEGTGLGLATCYGIVRQARGHIGVHSELGAGTTFRIFLPRCAEAAEVAECETNTRGLTILVVDDDEQIRTLVLRTLESAGFRVLVAEDGPSAIEAARECLSSIDLLLTDIIMPGMSGAELAAELAADRPETCVLYMSGYTASAFERQGLLRGNTELLQKPFTPAALRERIGAVLAGARSQS